MLETDFTSSQLSTQESLPRFREQETATSDFLENKAALENRPLFEKFELPFKATAVRSIEDLFGVVAERQMPPLSEKVNQNLHKLFDRVQESAQRLFIVENAGLRFAVIATNLDALAKNQDYIDAYMKFQANVIPDSLWMNCIYIHEFAAALGLTDGNAMAVHRPGTHPDKAVYPIRGIHDVGWKKVDEQFLWVDFTARPYIFSQRKAEESALEGLIVIEDIKTSIFGVLAGIRPAMQNLYQCSWERTSYNPTPSQRDLSHLQDKFVKKDFANLVGSGPSGV
jgi:hypothetical protein